MDSNLRFSLLIVVFLIAQRTSAQCFDSDPNCELYVMNGFCNSNLYSRAQVQFYCAKSCGFCEVNSNTNNRMNNNRGNNRRG
ncbi:unnamed protein product, partial [Mesorhabditis belari]|uniref:ShKT domain-containing protein n=1 Tax=Mesorhabditis belari TaxID=2138241 RepID=A0AAF3FBC4_9BILA